MNTADKFAEFRTHVPVLAHTAYFDTTSTGLVPDFVHDAVQRYQEDRYQKGGDSVWLLPDGSQTGTLGMMDFAKSEIAKMIGSQKENIVFGAGRPQPSICEEKRRNVHAGGYLRIM